MTMRMMKLKRVYHPVSSWEEVASGMYSDVTDKKAWLEKAVRFTGDHVLYGQAMMRVINEWPVSCENALTDSNINQKAWVGHAACALEFNCPEDIVREAWGMLSDEQRILANKQADRAIRQWRADYETRHGLRENMAGSLL